MTEIILIIIATFMTTVMISYHKKRKREDVLPNEHIFAEQYYSVYNSSNIFFIDNYVKLIYRHKAIIYTVHTWDFRLYSYIVCI